jgi:hypothetical protein
MESLTHIGIDSGWLDWKNTIQTIVSYAALHAVAGILPHSPKSERADSTQLHRIQ